MFRYIKVYSCIYIIVVYKDVIGGRKVIEHRCNIHYDTKIKTLSILVR